MIYFVLEKSRNASNRRSANYRAKKKKEAEGNITNHKNILAEEQQVVSKKSMFTHLHVIVYILIVLASRKSNVLNDSVKSLETSSTTEPVFNLSQCNHREHGQFARPIFINPVINLNLNVTMNEQYVSFKVDHHIYLHPYASDQESTND